MVDFHICGFLIFPSVIDFQLHLIWLENILCMISIFLNILRFFCGLTFDLSGRRFYIHFRRICTLLLLGRIFYIYIYLLIYYLCYFSSLLYPFWSSAFLSIIKNDVVKSPTVSVVLSISPLSYYLHHILGGGGLYCLMCIYV